MKKLLLTTAICGLAFAAAPAEAGNGVKLELGGHFTGYGAYVDQDEAATVAGDAADTNANTQTNDFDIIRDTEVSFSGETTLDNGLTVGAYISAEADGGDDFGVDESYVYFSGGWGRVNFGAEDGAAYLLQVSAPAADSLIDGIRQDVQPVNYDVLNNVSGASPAASVVDANGFDYAQDPTGTNDKFTYLSPVLNGFQAGLSFTPDNGAADDLEGIGTDEVEDSYGEAYEAALRYEGQFNNVGLALGAGYSHVERERESANPSVLDDRQVWNLGADLDYGPFGFGVIYTEDNRGLESNASADDEETLVVGIDYTTGPFKLGASYYDQDNTYGVKDDETQRYSGGVTYTYGPGMTFRGSLGYIEHEDNTAASDVDATYVTLGTEISF